MSWIWLLACASAPMTDSESEVGCTGEVTGTVYRLTEAFPEPEAGAEVTAIGAEELTVRTEDDGSYVLPLADGEWVLRASTDGGACAATDEPTVVLADCEAQEVDLTLDACVRR